MSYTDFISPTFSIKHYDHAFKYKKENIYFHCTLFEVGLNPYKIKHNTKDNDTHSNSSMLMLLEYYVRGLNHQLKLLIELVLDKCILIAYIYDIVI